MPWNGNRKCSGRMEDSAKLQISKTRALSSGVEEWSWEGLWCQSFALCSSSRGAATVLRPCWVALANEDSGKVAIRNTSGSEHACSFQDSPLVLI